MGQRRRLIGPDELVTKQPALDMSVDAPPRDSNQRTVGADRPSWTDALTGRPVLTIAEISLCLVTLALVLNLGRLFIDNSYLPKLAVTALVAHVVAAVRRRVSMPSIVSILLPIVGGVVLLTALHYPAQSTLGLPNGQVISALRSDMSTAFGPFRTLVAPVPLTVGFAVALGAAIWVVAQFADLAAFGGDAPVQAIIPHLAGFMFVSILAHGSGDTAARSRWAPPSRSSCSASVRCAAPGSDGSAGKPTEVRWRWSAAALRYWSSPPSSA